MGSRSCRLGRIATVASLFVVSMLLPTRGISQTPPVTDEQLLDIGLKELLNMQLSVSSPARKPQSLLESTSATFVISHDEIRQMGVTHLADALRIVPGLDVARTSNYSWAVSSRGFNQRFAERLLVMLDGQPIYTPLFGGTFWEHYDLVLDNIDRIEVIRGPGASLWGPNAMNGVINIITRDAKESVGTTIDMRVGDKERISTSATRGVQLSDDSYVRASLQGTKREDQRLESGGNSDDDWESYSGESRYDEKLSLNSSVSVAVRAFHSDYRLDTAVAQLTPPYVDTTTYSGPRRTEGANIYSKLTSVLDNGSDLQLAAGYNYEDHEGVILPLHSHTIDLDGQQHFKVNDTFDFLYGANVRIYHDDTDGNFADDLDPASRTLGLGSTFTQGDLIVIPNRLTLTAGAKLEKYESETANVLPTFRFSYTPTDKQAIWGAVSRAVRHPSRVAEDTFVPVQAGSIPDSPLPYVVAIRGTPNLVEEELVSHELGYRTELSDTLNFDLATFYNNYTHLNSLEPGDPTPNTSGDPYLEIPLNFSDGLEAHSYGAEVALAYQPIPSWRLRSSYAYLNLNVTNHGGMDEANTELFEGNSPQHTASLFSSLDVTSDVTFNSVLRFVSQEEYGNVPSYEQLDLNVMWKVTDSLELGIVGQNLLHDQTFESLSPLLGTPGTEISRGFFGTIRWKM